MENWFDYFRDRRFVPIFFVTLLALVVGPLIAGILFKIADDYNLLNYWPFALPGFFLWLVVFIWRAVALARARWRDRFKGSPLSRDELRKARSKLHGGTKTNPMNRPAPRRPDTYLKY